MQNTDVSLVISKNAMHVWRSHANAAYREHMKDSHAIIIVKID